MQLMCDAISVLGSRHGLLWNPIKKECGIIRFDRFDEMPTMQIRAGIVIEGKEYVLPLSTDGEGFSLYDQRISPCTMSVMGLDEASMAKLKLTAVTPFRPRDPEFSTTPVLGLRLTAEVLPGHYRWTPRKLDLDEVEIFIEFVGDDIRMEASGNDSLDLCFISNRRFMVANTEWNGDVGTEPLQQRDRLVATDGEVRGTRFVKRASLAGGAQIKIDIAWCTHSEPVLEVMGTRRPFKYATRFADVAAVADWARENPTAVFDNAQAVDAIIADNTCSKSVNNLLAQTLHAWLIDTWWADLGGKDWFSVWEGDCYFHSTVDVEYTQSPFYLAVWPELLKLELDQWPSFSKDGATLLGERGKDTLFLSHDIGCHSEANGQVYHHDMEVEESTNYVILSYAYYKRTGDDSMIFAHADTIAKYLDFVIACDTTGNGVPDTGVANTLDDASPAVQFGHEQVYLAVKALAALATGTEIMALVGKQDLAAKYRAQADLLRGTIEAHGWRGDHYATLLEKRGELIDPWTGEKNVCEEIPGWDAAHIYTLNGIALLDMIGVSLGLDEEKLRTDLRVATERCLREYGCVHSDFSQMKLQGAVREGLAGSALNPGWVSMNMLRDIAAFYRGVDLRHLADRYWEWQVTMNTQQPYIFFETFNGNNLNFYPRGIAIWGYFDALAGRVIDKPAGVERTGDCFPQVRVPRLLDAFAALQVTR